MGTIWIIACLILGFGIYKVNGNSLKVNGDYLNEGKHINEINQMTKKELKVEPPKSPYHRYIKWGVIIMVVLLLTLPFHYVPTELKMFPKDHLSLDNTFIFQSDIDHLIERYNKGDVLEKLSMMNEPLYKKLVEEDIIYREPSKEENPIDK